MYIAIPLGALLLIIILLVALKNKDEKRKQLISRKLCVLLSKHKFTPVLIHATLPGREAPDRVSDSIDMVLGLVCHTFTVGRGEEISRLEVPKARNIAATLRLEWLNEQRAYASKEVTEPGFLIMVYQIDQLTVDNNFRLAVEMVRTVGDQYEVLEKFTVDSLPHYLKHANDLGGVTFTAFGPSYLWEQKFLSAAEKWLRHWEKHHFQQAAEAKA